MCDTHVYLSLLLETTISIFFIPTKKNTEKIRDKNNITLRFSFKFINEDYHN